MKLLEEFTRDHVYEYDSSQFTVPVYHELTRHRRAMFWSLDDYFIYELKEKPLDQIVHEDILLEDS
jgi:hypothetical protein